MSSTYERFRPGPGHGGDAHYSQIIDLDDPTNLDGVSDQVISQQSPDRVHLAEKEVYLPILHTKSDCNFVQSNVILRKTDRAVLVVLVWIYFLQVNCSTNHGLHLRPIELIIL